MDSCLLAKTLCGDEFLWYLHSTSRVRREAWMAVLRTGPRYLEGKVLPSFLVSTFVMSLSTIAYPFLLNAVSYTCSLCFLSKNTFLFSNLITSDLIYFFSRSVLNGLWKVKKKIQSAFRGHWTTE